MRICRAHALLRLPTTLPASLAGVALVFFTSCTPELNNAAKFALLTSSPTPSPSTTEEASTPATEATSTEAIEAVPVLTIRSVSPDSGPIGGGTSVTVFGSHFAPGARVHFGAAPCVGVHVLSSDTLNCVTTARSEGAVKITVTNPGGLTGVSAGHPYFYDSAVWIGSQRQALKKWETGGKSVFGWHDGMIRTPRFIARDSSGNLYVTQKDDHRVSKYAENGDFIGWLGMISIPGGTCLGAADTFTGGWCRGGFSWRGSGDGMFNNPVGIAVSSDGFLYVVDTSNHRVQKFNLSTGEHIGWIGKIATAGGTCTAGVNNATGGWCKGGTGGSGTTAGMFNSPIAVTADANGFIYVSETGGDRISKFNASTGAFIGWIGKIASVGGTCTAGLNAFTGGWCSGGTTGSGTGSGMMTDPWGIVAHTDGILYVADSGNHRISKYTTSTGAFVGWLGRVNAAGGTCAPAGAFSGGWCSGGTSRSGTLDGTLTAPRSVSPAADGHIYVSDETNHRIAKYVTSTGAFVGWVGKIAIAGGTCTAGVGNFSGGWCAGAATGTSGGADHGDGLINTPQGVLAHGGFVYAADHANNRIVKFVATTGAFSGYLGASSVPKSSWSREGTTINSAVMDGDGHLAIPYSISYRSGFIYAVEYNGHRISKINATTGAYVGWIGRIGTVGGTCTAGADAFTGGWCIGGTSKSGNGDGMLNKAYDLHAHSDGFLYVADLSNHRVSKYNASTGAFIGWIGKIAAVGGTCTAGLNAFSGGWCIGGTPGSGTGDGMFNQATGVYVDAGGILYVGDGDNNRIQKFNAATGAFIGWLGKDSATGNSTSGWTTGSTGAQGAGDGMLYYPYRPFVAGGFIYVADANYRVSKFNATTGAFVGWLGKENATGGPTGGWVTGGTPGGWANGDGMLGDYSHVYVSPSGILYVGSWSGIQKYNAATGAFISWRGGIGDTVPTGGAAGCTERSVWGSTPGWCTGGKTQTGSGMGQFYGMGTVAEDGDGNLYAADGWNNRIYRMNP